MTHARRWLRQIIAIAPGPVAWRRMMLIGLGIAIAEVACVIAGRPADAPFAAISAYYVYSLDFGGPFRYRYPTVVVGLAAIVVGGTIGHVLADRPAETIVAVFVLATCGGIVYTAGPRVLQILRFATVALLVTSAFPQLGLNRIPPMAVGAGITLACAWLQQLVSGPERRLQPGQLKQEAQRLSESSRRHIRFALCYGAVAALGLWVGRELHLQRPYWVTVTTLFAMQPESGQTVVRMVQRVAGTLVAVPVTILALSLGQAPWFLMVVIAVSAFLIPLATARNYLVSSVVVVVFIIAVLDLVYLAQGGATSLLWLRFEETLIGAILAIGGMALTYAVPVPARRSRRASAAPG
jgi:hypothetical protein